MKKYDIKRSPQEAGKKAVASGLRALTMAVLFVVSVAAGRAQTVSVDATNFPDENFRAYLTTLSAYDESTNSIDVTAVTTMTITAQTYPELESLEGIKLFTSLTKLTLSSNNNSYLFPNLTTVDLSGITSLESVTMSGRGSTTRFAVETLNVSGCTALTYLSCSNNSLTSLDVSGCTALKTLYCYYNSLTSLDLSDNTKLTSLSCYSNGLTSLDLSNNTALTSLTCYSNNLTSLDLSNNTALTSLNCYSNNLTSLNLSGCTALTSLTCHSNDLTSLDVSSCAKLSTLNCSGNSLTNLDVSANTALTSLTCGGNPGIASLDLSANTTLKTLNITNTAADKGAMTSIDLSANTSLTTLTLSYTNMTTPNLSNNTALTSLTLRYNDNMTEIDLSNNTSLSTISAYSYKIKTWDLTANTNLTSVSLQLATSTDENGSRYSEIKLGTHPNLTTINVNQSYIREIDLTGCPALTEFRGAYGKFKTLDTSANPELVTLFVREGELKSLDLSNNLKLVNLNVFNNCLEALDITMLPATVQVGTSNSAETGIVLGQQNMNLCKNLVVVGENRDKVGFAFNQPYAQPSHIFNSVVTGDDGKGCVYLQRWAVKETSASGISYSRKAMQYKDVDIVEMDGQNYMTIYDMKNTDYFGTPGDQPIGQEWNFQNLPDEWATKAWYSMYVKWPDGTYPTSSQYSRLTNLGCRAFGHMMYANPVGLDAVSESEPFYSGTLCVPFDAKVPEGATCYIVTGITPSKISAGGSDATADQLTLVKVAGAGDILPANTPVYVKCTDGSGLYAFGYAMIADDNSTYVTNGEWTNKLERDVDYTCVTIPEGNLLKGVDNGYGSLQVTPKSVLTLGREQGIGTGRIGFWSFTGTYIGPYRCYLDAGLLKTSANSKGFTFNFVDGETTGISEVSDTLRNTQGWHTLDGRRLGDRPTKKGIYIHNGRKEVIR